MTPFYSLFRKGGIALAMFLMTVAPPHATQAAGGVSGFVQTNLVSDGSYGAKTIDPNLVNAWGLAESPSSPFWVSDNGTGFSTVYNANGTKVPLDVMIPGPGGSGKGSPTGIVFNSTGGFMVSKGKSSKSGPSAFIFATEDGTISGWNSNVDATHAINMVDRSATGAVYKGLARIGGFLFAANFHDARIDVFDSSWRFLGFFHNGFIPSGFAPFNVMAAGNQLVVTYAMQKLPDKHDDQSGPGNGFVSVLNPFTGVSVRFASNGVLNSPWGMAFAPSGFGPFSGALLIGNFGDGAINAFDPRNGHFLGRLRDKAGNPIVIDGLWGLLFGNGTQAGGAANVLYFTAGPGEEQHGLFGSLTFVP